MMSEGSYIQELYAERIGGKNFGTDTVSYKFEKIKRAKKQAMEEHPTIKLIDLGVGEPDWMAEKDVIEVLSREAAKRENRGYSDNGSDAFKIAACAYMDHVFSVKELNPLKEVNHCIGSKTALAQLPAAFINPGDITLMTTPGYPIVGTHTNWFGGEVYAMPLLKENNFLPDLNAIPKEIRARAKLLYMNYPNNPTGASATIEFYEEVVEFAKRNGIIVISDEAYAALTFDNTSPLSFLSVKGAKDVGVCIHSLSKSYNMTGWRLGFVAGNEWVVKALASVKDNHDSGQFLAIQKAGVYCLSHPEITIKTADKYSRRHNLIVQALREIGFDAIKPSGSFFLYVKAPKGIHNGIKFHTAEDFSQYLIREKLISTVPWDEAGNYIRFSVTFEASGLEEEMKVIDEIKARLCGVGFYW